MLDTAFIKCVAPANESMAFIEGEGVQLSMQMNPLEPCFTCGSNQFDEQIAAKTLATKSRYYRKSSYLTVGFEPASANCVTFSVQREQMQSVRICAVELELFGNVLFNYKDLLSYGPDQYRVMMPGRRANADFRRLCHGRRRRRLFREAS